MILYTQTDSDGQRRAEWQSQANLYREKQMLYYVNISHSTQQHNYMPTNYNTTRACSQASGSVENAPVVPMLGLSRAHVRHKQQPSSSGSPTNNKSHPLVFFFSSPPATSTKYSLTHCYSNTHTHTLTHPYKALASSSLNLPAQHGGCNNPTCPELVSLVPQKPFSKHRGDSALLVTN